MIMLLDEVLESNKEFVKEFDGVKISHIPQKKLVIVTCMDTRLTDGFLEQAIGLKRGDAKIIKNAGNTIVGRDVIRSVAAAIFALDAEEVMLVGHCNCGMASVDSEKLKAKMRDKGISPDEIDKINLTEWIGAIESEESNVISSVKEIKNSPLIPNNIPIHGLIIDPITGKINTLIKGY